MFSKVFSLALEGLKAKIIEIEVDIQNGLPSFTLVGLPDTSIQEAKERVRSAIKNAGFDFPTRRITVNLAPADIRKEGSLYDLPIAIGVLKASGAIKEEVIFDDKIFIGELSLDSKIREVKGVLPLVAGYLESKGVNNKKNGDVGFIIPDKNLKELSLLKDLKVKGAEDFKSLVSELNDSITYKNPYVFIKEKTRDEESQVNFKDIKGQKLAKRALEVAASGFHNVLLIGPPGAGKTMLAERFMTILPEMNEDEILEVTKIYSVAGLLKEKGLIIKRSFRSPHHTASSISIIGGGMNPKPGEISLAHRGVLFLDELAEFRRDVLEVLRQPLESGVVNISRVKSSLEYPAKFIFIGAMNPCPCGYYLDPHHSCSCSIAEIKKYRKKISGPLLDRFDIVLNVPKLTHSELVETKEEEDSSKIKERVEDAFKVQKERFKGKNIYTNSEMKGSILKKYTVFQKEEEEFLKIAVQKFSLTARGFDKILRLSRTIADLDKSEKIKVQHLAEAVQYRNLKDFMS